MPKLTIERAAAFIAAAVLVLCAIRSPRAAAKEPVRILVHRRHGAALPTSSAKSAAAAEPTVAMQPAAAAPAPQIDSHAKPLNLDSLSGLRSAAALAEDGELIMTTSDWNGVGSAVNLARQLARFSLEKRVLLLADRRRTCVRAQAVWPWLACGFSRGIPGFKRRYSSLGMPLVDMWNLWSAKWLVLARLVELQLSVLMMDSDILVLSDPYALLLASPLSYAHLVLPPEGSRVNVGFLYARGATAKGGMHSLLWDVVRRLRLFIELQTLYDARGNPSVSGLWDQGECNGHKCNGHKCNGHKCNGQES